MSTGAIVLWIVFAVAAGMISDRKNNGFVNGFIIGVLLNIFGVIIVICLKPGLPKAPKGLVAVKCSRCAAVQNVPADQPQFQCWQCQTLQPSPFVVKRPGEPDWLAR
jgi:hypothetical protein